MNKQGWKSLDDDKSGDDYDVQSTYIPPEPQYDDPFAPATGSPFVINEAEATVPAPSASVPSAVDPKNGPSSTVLEFHDSGMPQHDVHGKMNAQQTATANQVPPVQASYSAAQRLLGGFMNSSSDGPNNSGGDDNVSKAAGFFSLRRYRKHFNVDTLDVLSRMLDSVIGCFRPNFLEKTADSADLYVLFIPSGTTLLAKKSLPTGCLDYFVSLQTPSIVLLIRRYGPFWVATTLVFVSAVTGNYASYISYKHNHSGSQTAMDSWFYDIDKVGYSAILFYGYVGIIGFVLFAVLKWGFKGQTSLVQTWCAYGYSLSVFIPMSFFCIFPVEALRWSLVGAATLTSGLFLLLNFRKPIFEVAGARALPVWLIMAALHAGLGLALKLYFFHYSSTR